MHFEQYSVCAYVCSSQGMPNKMVLLEEPRGGIKIKVAAAAAEGSSDSDSDPLQGHSTLSSAEEAEEQAIRHSALQAINQDSMPDRLAVGPGSAVKAPSACTSMLSHLLLSCQTPTQCDRSPCVTYLRVGSSIGICSTVPSRKLWDMSQ